MMLLILHRLSSRYANAWDENADKRRELAIAIARLYPGEEIVVTDATTTAIGQISPTGIYKKVPEPRPTAPAYMAANNPGPDVCPCRKFYHVNGAHPTYGWETLSNKERQELSGGNGHHPMCQYNPSSYNPDMWIGVGKSVEVVKAAMAESGPDTDDTP